MQALRRKGMVACVVLVGATMASYQHSRAQQVTPITITAAAIAAAQSATDVRCHIFPVQPGHGARAPGQPGHGLPPNRPDCDIPVPAAAPDSAPTTPGQDMTFHGGATVQTASHIFLFLNPPNPCCTDWGDPVGFLNDLNASNLIHVTDQYVGTTANGRYNFGQGFFTTFSEPHTMQVSDVQALITALVHAAFPAPGGGGGGYNVIYHLFLPPGQDHCFTATQCYSPDVPANFVFCAYHTAFNTTDANGAAIHVLYSVEPYQNVNGCQWGGPYPNGSLVDSTNSTFSHEIIETITDPDPGTGWFHVNTAGEIGDLCAYFFMLSPVTLNGKSYGVQSEYSNKIHMCGSSAGVSTLTHDFNYTAGVFMSPVRSDLLWYNNSTGTAVVWLLNGTSVTGGGSPGAAASPWAPVGQRDFNGDGNTDILWRNGTTGQLVAWFLNGAGVSGGGTVGTAAPPWTVFGTGDFNGDGFGDVLWWNASTGQALIWLLNGTSVIGGGSPGTAASPWTVVGTGDFNGDGKTDILWYNTMTGSTVIWLLNGTSVIGGGSIGTVGSPWSVAGTGDFNGDGNSDIVWLNSMTGQALIWFLNGASVIGGGSPGSAPGWSIAETGDFNSDGNSDLLWYNSGTGQALIWFLHGTSVIGGGSPGSAGSPWIIANQGAD